MTLTPEQVNEILNSFDKISSVVGGTSQTDRKKANAEQIRVFDLAIADFTQAIRLDPDNAKAYKERGSSYNSTMTGLLRTLNRHYGLIRIILGQGKIWKGFGDSGGGKRRV